MTRNELVDRCKDLIREAYEEATEMIVAYLELHPTEQLKPLCREIDADNWNALRQRVQRAQAKRKATTEAGSSGSRTLEGSRIRHARSVLRDPDLRAQAMSGMSPVERAEVVRAAVPPPDASRAVRSGPSFIDLLVRISGALIELEAMVAGWQNPAAVPAEFSRESFTDIVAKTLRIQDRFDELVTAIDNGDEDEFMNIVRNFRVVER